MERENANKKLVNKKLTLTLYDLRFGFPMVVKPEGVERPGKQCQGCYFSVGLVIIWFVLFVREFVISLNYLTKVASYLFGYIMYLSNANVSLAIHVS